VPRFLSLLSDRPGEKKPNQRLRDAINLYVEIGMEGCVRNFPHYRELLNSMAARIRDMPELPPGPPTRFADLGNAFEYDWVAHFRKANVETVQAEPRAEEPSLAPAALASMVVFYITRRSVTYGATPVDFADRLIVEPGLGDARQTDPSLAALLADVRGACAAEGVTVLHAAMEPVVPLDVDALLGRLAALSARRILAAVCVDDSISGYNRDRDRQLVDMIISSPRRTGLVFSALNASAEEARARAAQRKLPHGVYELPSDSAARIALLRQAVVDLRGTILSQSTERAADAEPVPLLRGHR
jgi:hypothetical protein